MGAHLCSFLCWRTGSQVFGTYLSNSCGVKLGRIVCKNSIVHIKSCRNAFSICFLQHFEPEQLGRGAGAAACMCVCVFVRVAVLAEQ